MTGNVAQIIALVSYGNAFLRYAQVDSFYPDNAAFQFCNSVEFRLSSKVGRFFKKQKISVVAEDPNVWFRTLEAEKCQRLCLRYWHTADEASVNDYMLAGLVGGGGIWSIESVYEHGSKFWTAYWDVTQDNSPEDRIWSVTYLSDCNSHETIRKVVEVSGLKERLGSCLIRLQAFALSKDLGQFAAIFESAREALHSRRPEEGHDVDLLAPGSHTLVSRQFRRCEVMGFWWNGIVERPLVREGSRQRDVHKAEF